MRWNLMRALKGREALIDIMIFYLFPLSVLLVILDYGTEALFSAVHIFGPSRLFFRECLWIALESLICYLLWRAAFNTPSRACGYLARGTVFFAIIANIMLFIHGEGPYRGHPIYVPPAPVADARPAPRPVSLPPAAAKIRDRFRSPFAPQVETKIAPDADPVAVCTRKLTDYAVAQHVPDPAAYVRGNQAYIRQCAAYYAHAAAAHAGAAAR